MAKQLATPLLDLGIENPNFFEGRLLTAGDLKAFDQANRARQRQLGCAAGTGVVKGLWVKLLEGGSGGSQPVVSVSCGLAFNRKGQALEIRKEKEEIALIAALEARTDAGLFRDCTPPPEQVAATGEGVWVLALSPASGYGEETAAMSGLGSGKMGAGCGRKWAVEGVQLRLVPLNPLTVTGVSSATKQLLQTELLGATDVANLSKLRNVLAHLCFGTEQLAGFAADPFARQGGDPAFAAYGAFDHLRALGKLTDCDVPLAILFWTASGVQFLDNWAARRRPAAPATSEQWPSLSCGRRPGKAEAVLFQFQDQLAETLASSSSPNAIKARDYFRWLPPAGLLPLQASGRFRAPDENTFFDGCTVRGSELFTEGARVRSLIQASFDFPGFGVAGPEMFWAYRVRDNHPPPPPAAAELPYVLFASGFMPFFGHSRFDLSRWDRSNFGLL